MENRIVLKHGLIRKSQITSKLLASVVLGISLYTHSAFAQNIIVQAEEVRGFTDVQVKALGSDKPVRVIARLSAGALDGAPGSLAIAPAALTAPSARVKTAQDRLAARLQKVGIRGVQNIEGLPLVVLEANFEQLDQLIATGEIAEVVEDRLSSIDLSDSTALIGATTAHTAGSRGAGQTIAILDTGVQSNHPFLTGRVVEEACYSTTSTSQNATSLCPSGASSSTAAGSAAPCTGVSGCDHGTHVAGIAAGRASGTTTFNGVAPDANIFAIKVFTRFTDSASVTPCADADRSSPCILSYSSDQLRALQRVRDRRAARNIVAANMSLGGGRFTSSCNSDSLAAIIGELKTAGVATVISAGNDGYRDAVGAPACITAAVTVGSTTKTDGISSFSNISSLVDLLAPGSSINSSVTSSGFGSKNGTSMAAPHVAGALAVLKARSTTATVDHLVAALQNSATYITVPGTSPSLSLGRINLNAALSLITFRPASGQLYQLHNTGRIWAFRGADCTGSSCPSWTMLDANSRTIAVAGGGTALYQLHNNGSIWRYTGTPCTGISCWQMIGNDTRATAIAAGGSNLYQLRSNGEILRYTGTPCSGSTCSGWQRLDNNSNTVEIVADGSALYQRHRGGAIWRYTGTACSGNSCPGWQQLDGNPNTVQIVADNSALYQRHSGGAIWRYTGTPCSTTACPGWQQLDGNPAATSIAAGGGSLYQLHSNGRIWRYTGTPCSAGSCPGWSMLNNNSATVQITASTAGLFERRSNGQIHRYTGTACSGNTCSGWRMVDNNPAARSITTARR